MVVAEEIMNNHGNDNRIKNKLTKYTRTGDKKRASIIVKRNARKRNKMVKKAKANRIRKRQSK